MDGPRSGKPGGGVGRKKKTLIVSVRAQGMTNVSGEMNVKES